MPWPTRFSAASPLTLDDSTRPAAATAASAAAARTSASACASAWAIFVLGHLGAARDEFLELGLAFGGEPLGFRTRRLDDALRLALGGLALLLVFGEQRGGFVLEAPGLVELALDAVATVCRAP